VLAALLMSLAAGVPVYLLFQCQPYYFYLFRWWIYLLGVGGMVRFALERARAVSGAPTSSGATAGR
jgi:hypothetical protein